MHIYTVIAIINTKSIHFASSTSICISIIRDIFSDLSVCLINPAHDLTVSSTNCVSKILEKFLETLGVTTMHLFHFTIYLQGNFIESSSSRYDQERRLSRAKEGKYDQADFCLS